MKNKYLLIGTIATAVLASVAIINPFFTSTESAYESRNSKSDDIGLKDANGSAELNKLLKGDPLTGVIDAEEVKRARANAENLFARAGVISWDEEGPSNIGGRTRAILIDNQNQYHVLAGSVSGGLFESGSRGDYWARVANFSDNLAISTMAQTPNGTIVIGTGFFSEGINHTGTSNGNSGAFGDGIFVYANGDLSQNPVLIPTTDSWSFVNEIIADEVNNVVWILASSGVWTYNTDNGALTDVSSIALSTISTAGVMSKDGMVICLATQNRHTSISKDGGASFNDYSLTLNTSNPIPVSGNRIEYAISHERVNGEYFIYATLVASVGGTFAGAYVSSNSGVDWFEIAPDSQGGTGQFNPYNNQGWHNTIISVVPGSPETAFLGGVDIYSWSSDVNNPTFGSWNQTTNWASSPTSPIYAHADQHEMKWDDMGRYYIGNDGGVGYSDDNGMTFTPANRGYNVTQFYSVAYSAHGDIMGGTQDNGSLYNDHTNFSWQDFSEVLGGDGFDCDISHSNRDVIFSSLYYVGLFRSSDRGVSQTAFYPNQLANGMTPGSSTNGPGNFNTVIRYHEVYDLATTDSVKTLPNQPYSIGDTLIIASNSKGDSITFITPDSIRFEDTTYYDVNIVSYEYTVEDCNSSANRDLGTEMPWSNINSGQYPPLLGDTILIYKDILDPSDDDTVVVCDTTRYRFYYATDPNNNDTLAMHIDSVLYNVAWDTVVVQDPYISWLAIGIGQGDWVNGTSRDLGIWMTRYAKRFSDNIGDNEIWLNVQPAVGGSRVMCMEFSRNADFLYVGTTGGRLYRMTGYNDYYASSPDILDSLQGWNPISTGTSTAQWDLIWSQPNSATITGIGVDYNASSPNGDHLIVCVGNFSSSINFHAYEVTNASTCSMGGANATPIHASGEFNFPVYDAVIDRVDPNFVALATEYGVYVTENVSAGTVLWENCSGDFGLTPVHALRQDWRTWGEGSTVPGRIYAGTHGRGIWSSSSLLTLPDETTAGIEKEVFTTDLTIFPNPMTSTGYLKFKLENNSDVYINIYSLSGKLIKNISKSGLSKGDNTVNFNVSDLPIGTYLVQFKAGSKVETGKFIKVR